MSSLASPKISEVQIAKRANLIWQQSGRIDGQTTENWLQAERELAHERIYGSEPRAEPNIIYQYLEETDEGLEQV